MYSSIVIDQLAERIAYAPAVQPSPIVLESRNAGTSGRTARSFHALVTVENIWLTMAMPPQSISVNADNAVLNEHLYDLKKQAVLQVLSRVFDLNDRANNGIDRCGNPIDNSGTDYTSKITSNPARFDEAIGYQLAYMAMEQMLTSTRSNSIERKVADKGQIKLEMEGTTDETGSRSYGVAGKLSKALKALIDSLFPVITPKPTLRARRVW